MKLNKLISYLFENIDEASRNILVKASDLDQENKRRLEKYIEDADVHPEFAGLDLVKGLKRDNIRLAILDDDGIVVGFMTPRQDRGYWRTGAIYTDLEVRGKGYAKRAIEEFFKDGSHQPARVWISDNNKRSQSAFVGAGFKKGSPRAVGEGPDREQGHDYYLGEVDQSSKKPKKLLLLVHPDVVFEISETEFIESYKRRLEKELSEFDHVITHLMFSPVAPEVVPGIKERKKLWDEFKVVLENKSDWIGLDHKFSASFSDALPDYLIENEGTQIWLGGGYKDLCVADTKKSLLRSLDDIIKETGASIAGCYAPLIITQRHNPSFGDQPVKEHYSALRECIKMITENEIKQRSHMSKEEIGEFKNILPNEQEISHKPKGFWYDCDGEWSNWVEFNMPEWMGEHEYDVELDHSKMIVIRNFQQLKEFNEKYSIKPEESEDLDNDYLIDWRRVAAEYAGIEICPYISKVQQIRETGKVYEWYSTWDVASGCVWNREAIKSIEKKNKKSLGNDIWYHTTSRKNWEKIREQGLKVGSPPKFSMASLEYMSSIYGRVPLFFSKSPDLYRNLQSGDDLVTLEVDLSGIPKLADIPSLIDHGANIDPDREIIWFEEEETPPSLQQFIDLDIEGISFDELGHPGEVSNAAIELTGTCAIIQDINKDKIKIYN